MILIVEKDKVIGIAENTESFKDCVIKKDSPNIDEWWDYQRFLVESWPNLLKRAGFRVVPKGREE